MIIGESTIAALLGLGLAAVICTSIRLPERWRGRAHATTPRVASADPADQVQPEPLIEVLMTDVALRFAPDGGLVHASRSTTDILRITPEELADPTGSKFDDPLGIGAVLPALARLEPNEETTLRIRRSDQEMILVHATCHPIPDHEDRMVMLRDVTRQTQTEQRLDEARERLSRLANEDALTGLANRACFMETAERLMAGVEPLAMLFIDLDRFRPINDVHGPNVGDLILRTTASRLARELADEPIVARLGADEFAILMRAPDGDDPVASRVRDMIRVISDPIEVGPMTLDVSATVGIAVGPRDGTRAGTLLRAASIAMTQARLAGGGCYRFFERRMSEELTTAEELKADLRSAIAAGEITPFFQPLVRLDDGQIVGFEVLARWEHPERGLLPPMLFLPLVEETGLSAAMFASILSQSCAAARDWPAHIRLSVNISPQELQDESLPEDMSAILAANGFDPGRIEIEVTENALIHDSRIARGVVNRLRAMGLSMALDDFGTGFSSLYHLRELPFDKIKIDKSFMHALDTDAESARYVAAIVGLGQSLGLELTAEGIEDPASAARLRDMGCTYGQGYLFGRPMPASDAGRMVMAGSSAMIAAE